MKKRNPDEALRESPRTAESQFLKFTWVAVVLLAIILGGVGLFYMTCRKRTQEPFREPATRLIPRFVSSDANPRLPNTIVLVLDSQRNLRPD
jgi:hypothetical protein